MNTNEVTSFMHSLCDLAEQETLPRFRTMTNVSNKLTKGFDPVTEADRNAEKVIREEILSKYPDHGIFGEEFGTHNENAEYCWVIDPIDGTRAFISGLPVWGTLIGLYKNGKPYSGIMHQPFTGERYFTKSDNSFLKRSGQELQIKTSEVSSLDESILFTTTPDLFDENETPRYFSLEEKCKLARYGTDCYAYCLLASGNIELVVESGLHIYDIAALIPIIENAGGIVTDWLGNDASRGGQILAAANTKIHQQAMEILAE